MSINVASVLLKITLCVIAVIVWVLAAAMLLSKTGDAQCGNLSAGGNTLLPCASRISSDVTVPDIIPPPEYLEVVDFDSPPISLTRVSENTLFGAEDGRARHQYSRRQAWSSDEKLLDIGGKIIDASSFAILDVKIPMSSERVWSNIEPAVLFGLRFQDDKLNQFVRYDVKSDQWQEIILLSEFSRCTIGRGEGTLSEADERVVFICSDAQDAVSLISFSLDAGEILGTLKVQDEVNWAGFSNSGNYIVLESRPSPDARKVLTRYSPALLEPMLLTKDRHHGDFGVDENGDDAFVMIGPDKISYIILESGLRFYLPISSFMRPLERGHLSCRNLRRPGWCYFSAHNGIIGSAKITNPGRFQFPSLFDSNQSAFEHWGYHYSSAESYNAQPKLVPSPSGRAVLFTSDWGGEGQINDYVAIPRADR